MRASRTLAVLLIVILALVLLAPIYSVVMAGLREEGRISFAWFGDVFADPLYREGILNSFYIAAATTLLTLIISIPLALISDSYEFPFKKLLLLLLNAPLILPPFVGAIGMKGMLSRNGGINELLVSWGWLKQGHTIDFLGSPFWSCVIVEALYLYPIAFLNAQAALANLDPSMVEAARDLGAGRWRSFFGVRLPLIRSGIFAGASIIFIWSFTELGTPLMVGFRRLTAVQVFDELQTTAPQGDAYALVVVLLAISVLVYALSKLVFGRPVQTITPKAGVAKIVERKTGIKALLLLVPFVIVLVAATLPHIGVMLTSVSSNGSVSLHPADWTLKHHENLVGVSETSSEIRELAVHSVENSAKYAFAATTVDLFLGFGIAWLVVRRRGRLTFVLDAMAMLPLAVPGLVLAFGYFAMTQTGGWLSRLDPISHDPTPLLVLAYSVRRLPFMVRSCAAGLEQLPEAMEEAAIDLGASWKRTLSRITLPLLAPSFLAGGVLVFSRSMLEVSDSLILAFDRQTYPMTKAIWSLAAIPSSGMESASVLGCWGMILLLATFAIASKVLGKRLGGVFRL